ncbi:MAG: sigma-54-dependent transcriptional regulator, partial [bacterium]
MEPVVEHSAKKCLAISNESTVCRTIISALEPEGWAVRACNDLIEARAASGESTYDLALIDLRMGRHSGLELLPVLQAQQQGMPVIIITAHASIPGAVDAMRRGAMDYLPKPFSAVSLRRAVTLAMAAHDAQWGYQAIRCEPVLESRAPGMQVLLERIRKVALSGTTTILLQGETGTGKGVLAKAVHDLSPRREGPFVVVSCPALPMDMLE